MKESYKDHIHIYFDDDGVLHKWNSISVSIPDCYSDLNETQKADYIKKEIYQVLLTPGYFRNLPPQQNMVALMKHLMDAGYDVNVLTCSINKNTDRQKEEAMKICAPWFSKDRMMIVPDGCGTEKYLYIPTDYRQEGHINILIDDHTPNCIGFEVCGGISIKCMNDVNGKGGSWTGKRIYADDLSKSIAVMEQLLNELEAELEKDIEQGRE